MRTRDECLGGHFEPDANTPKQLECHILFGPPLRLRNGGPRMANKRHKPEEIVKKLRQVDVLVGQGMMRVDAIREVCIWWRNANLWRGV